MNNALKPIVLGPITFQVVKTFFPKANVETPIEHGLQLIPVGAWPIAIDKACNIFSGQMPPASNVLNLVSDTDAVTATILVLALNLTER